MSKPSDPSASKPGPNPRDPKDPKDQKGQKELKDLKGADSFTLPQLPSGDMPQNMGLADLARGLQYVVNETAMAAYLHTQKTLDLYFDAEGNPLCRRVRLPGGAGVVDVPKLALTPPANLLLDQMEVSLAVRITNLSPASGRSKTASGDEPTDATEADAQSDSTDQHPHVFVAPADEPEDRAGSDAVEGNKASADGQVRDSSDAIKVEASGPSSPQEPSASDPQPPNKSGSQRVRASSFALSEDDIDPQRDERVRGSGRSFDRLSFEIQPAPVSPDATARRAANVMDIKMIFRRNESPEGVARLVSLYTESMFRVNPSE